MTVRSSVQHEWSARLVGWLAGSAARVIDLPALRCACYRKILPGGRWSVKGGQLATGIVHSPMGLYRGDCVRHNTVSMIISGNFSDHNKSGFSYVDRFGLFYDLVVYFS